MANWQVEPSFVHVFWLLSELLIFLLLWVVIYMLCRVLGDEVFELFWQDFAPTIFKMKTKGLWLWGVRLCNRFWGGVRNRESCLLSRWLETFRKGFYAFEYLSRGLLWTYIPGHSCTRLKVLASKAAFVCTCSLKFTSFLSCHRYCATKEQSLARKIV